MVAGDAKPKASFAARVSIVVRQIPRGRVTTYGLIALALGVPRSARVVGWSLNRAVDDQPVPAHRVVNRDGYVSGGHRFGHPDVMKAMLLSEEVTFRDKYVVDLDTHLWDPSNDPEVRRLLVRDSSGFDPPPDFPA